MYTYNSSMTRQTWLITGGAGYVGSHIADLFLANGKDVVILDSLRQGLESRVDYLRQKHEKVIPFIDADIRDMERFAEVLSAHRPYGVIHTAALKSVSKSIEDPDEYFEVNLAATTKLLELLILHNIQNLIFSSTAAVYGSPDHALPIKEEHPKSPISPYGASKLAAEKEVERFLSIPGNNGTSLRFFNVVGTAAPELLDNSRENLVPIVINSLKVGQPPVIFGDDYQTSDGTCVRDYVDVRDVAKAHLAAASSQKKLPLAMNIGTGNGASVYEVIRLICDLGSHEGISPITLPRRSGDPAFLCADPTLMRSELNFTASYSLKMSIQSLFD